MDMGNDSINIGDDSVDMGYYFTVVIIEVPALPVPTLRLVCLVL
jgi:hypothetical protein